MKQLETKEATTTTETPQPAADERGSVSGSMPAKKKEPNEALDADNSGESSSGSSEGKRSGGGSGGGYSADFSDQSSSDDTKTGVNVNASLAGLNLGDMSSDIASSEVASSIADTDNATREKQNGKSGAGGTRKREKHASKSRSKSKHSSTTLDIEAVTNWSRDQQQLQGVGHKHMPQLNGVRIAHPMDPRIDLSAVGYVQANVPALHTALAASPTVKSSAQNHLDTHTTNPYHDPCAFDNYAQLMEVSV